MSILQSVSKTHPTMIRLAVEGEGGTPQYVSKSTYEAAVSTLNSLSSQISAAQAILDQDKKQITSLKAQIATVQSQLVPYSEYAAVTQQITQAQSTLSQAKAQITADNAQINTLTAQLAALQSQT
jgi:septal ring factor EnvC (AmiA/AmiB activator)